MNELHPVPSQRFMAAALLAMSGIPGKADRFAAAVVVAGQVERHYQSISALLQGTETGDTARKLATEWTCARINLRTGAKFFREREAGKGGNSPETGTPAG